MMRWEGTRHGPGGHEVFAVIVMPAMLGGLVLVAMWAVRALISSRCTPPPRRDEPMEIVRRRLAAGEITDEEFERTRKLLGG